MQQIICICSPFSLYQQIKIITDGLVTEEFNCETKFLANSLVEEYKFPVWIYGHDHKENDITINNTRFVSNPWGYDTKDFKIKSLTLKK